MVAGFISYKTPEAVHHILRAGKSLHCIEAKKLPGCVWKNQQQQHNDLEIPLELSINKCTYQYPFFRNNHYYEDSPNLSYRCCGNHREYYHHWSMANHRKRWGHSDVALQK